MPADYALIIMRRYRTIIMRLLFILLLCNVFLGIDRILCIFVVMSVAFVQSLS